MAEVDVRERVSAVIEAMAMEAAVESAVSEGSPWPTTVMAASRMAAHVASRMSMSATKAAAGTAAEVTATAAEMPAATTSTVAASTALRECRRSAHGEHRRKRDGNNELLE